MIAFRQVDARDPPSEFVWDDASQPAGRWHAEGDGPAHYFADTPDGAWAEFLRHEEITDPGDLLTIRRQMWAVEIGDGPVRSVALPPAVLFGGIETYAQCQDHAREMRRKGASRIAARSAALVRGGARAIRLDINRDKGMRPAEPRDGLTIVLFGSPAELRGWLAADAARPGVDLLERVHHYGMANG